MPAHSPIPDIPVVFDRFPGVYLAKFRTLRRKGARGVTDKQGVNGIGVASHASVERVKVTGWPIVSQIIKRVGLAGCEIVVPISASLTGTFSQPNRTFGVIQVFFAVFL